MKVCTKCGQEKRLSEFAFSDRNLSKRQSWCRECNNAAGRENYQENKERYFRQARKRDRDLDELINAYKSVPCADCGVQYQPYVMDFDHLGDKILKISMMRRRRMSFVKIEAEIAKCDVVCANCHRERTNQRNPARYMEKK